MTESTRTHPDQFEGNAEFIEVFFDAPLEVSRSAQSRRTCRKKRVPAKSANSPESMLPTKRRTILRSSCTPTSRPSTNRLRQVSNNYCRSCGTTGRTIEPQSVYNSRRQIDRCARPCRAHVRARLRDNSGRNASALEIDFMRCPLSYASCRGGW